MPFMSANQLVEAAGSGSEAATIVMPALTSNVWALKKTTKLIGSQIPEHWLERAPDVAFTRLSDDEARAHLQRCGQLLYVDRFSRPADDEAVVLIAVVSDAGCSMIGSNYFFDRTIDGWQRASGLGGGYLNAALHCSCTAR
jgi:hypothetical protein